jgi:ATP/ADP translocase
MSLSHRLGLKARELQKAMWLGAVLMAITASYTLVKTARDSLFLSRLPAASLPWVYIVVGVATLAASMAIERITRDRSPLGSLLGTLTAAALGLAAFTPLAGVRASWLPVGFYLYVNAYGLILVSQFWVYANSSSDPREMKRICGIVGGSGILGGLAGGLLDRGRRRTVGGLCSAAHPRDRS